MRKVLVVAAGLAMVTSSAFSQSSDDTSERGSSYSRRDRDLDDLLRGIDGEMGRGAASRGASFLLRSGDATVAVRCDPRDTMRACVEATTILLDRARAALPPAGSGPSGPAPGTPPARQP